MAVQFAKTAAYLTSIGMDPSRVLVHEFTNPISYIRVGAHHEFSWHAWPMMFDWKRFRMAYDDDTKVLLDQGRRVEEIFTDEEGEICPWSHTRMHRYYEGLVEDGS